MVTRERADLMPVTEELITELARSFIGAEQRCAPIEPITSLYPDLTEADAYRVQMAVVATKVARGDRVTGRKVGATSQPIQQLLGIDEPIYGTFSKAIESLTARRSCLRALSIHVLSAKSHSC
jgi:2-keto-4-pentenoate hydratase